MVLTKAAQIAAKGVFTGSLYHFRKQLNIPQNPTFLVYQLTNNCNSRCNMCNIWKKESKGELELKDIKRALRTKTFSKIRWVNLTGGEPFLRKDIVDIVREFSKLKDFEGVAIPTNGFLSATIERRAKDILKVLRPDQFLSITLSIDGFEKTHDQIRGVPGAYKKVMETLDRLTAIPNKNFNVGVQPTITHHNIDEMDEFYGFLKTKVHSVGFAVMLASEGYYDNKDSDASLDDKDRRKVARILKKSIKSDPQYTFYYTKLIEQFKTGKRGYGCLAGYLTLYMDPVGNVSPCPILSVHDKYRFGKAADDPWFSGKAKKIRNDLKKEKICTSCSLLCDFINVAKVEFIEHAMFLLQHPTMIQKMLKYAKNSSNPYI